MILNSCEKTEKVDNFPKHNSKLVTNCFFNSDTSFIFNLSRSLSPIDNAPFRIMNSSNAYIKIFEENILFDSFRFNSIDKCFHGDLSKTPSKNKNYRFECYYPGYPKVSGEDYLPDDIKIGTTNGYHTVQNLMKYNDTLSYANYTGYLTIKINPTNNLSDKYIIIQMFKKKRYSGTINYFDNYPIYPEEISNINESESIGEELYISNENNIKEIKLKWEVYYDYLLNNKIDDEYEIEITTCSKNSFEYLKRYKLQTFNADDPFSEPTPISNNIENGYGIFGGISIKKHVVKL